MVDSIAVTVEVLILIYYLHKSLPAILESLVKTGLRIGMGILVSVIVVSAVFYLTSLPNLFKAILALLLATLIYLPFIKKEIRLLLKL